VEEKRAPMRISKAYVAFPPASPNLEAYLQAAEQIQNQQNDEDQPNSAARVIAPAPAVGPFGNRAQQRDNQNDREY
jgi:hypothetical protein